MTLEQLEHEQKVALVALLEAIAISDGLVSEGEERQIASVAEKLGEEAYRQLLDEAEKRCPDIDALKSFLIGIEDKEARNLIYGMVMEEMMAVPAGDHSQSELLSWLAQNWNIDVEVDTEQG